MDEFEQTLKRDAEHIRAEVSPDLRARIDASLRAIEPIRPERARRRPHASLWWASSLTGLAAAVVVIVLLNLRGPDAGPAGPSVAATRTVPEQPGTGAMPAALEVRTAEFTAPLEDELQHLQSDLRRARDTVREDLDFTF